MDEHNIDKAMEDIRIIKEVIDKTSLSIVSIANIFFWWALIFSLKLILKVTMHISQDILLLIHSNQIVPILIEILPIICVIAVFMYYKRSNKILISGLGKQVLNLWGASIIFSVIFNNTNFIRMICFEQVHNVYFINNVYLMPYGAGNMPMHLFCSAFALYSTSVMTDVMTDFKFTKWLVLVNIVIGFLCTFQYKAINYTYFFTLVVFIASLISMGVYLRYKSSRRN